MIEILFVIFGICFLFVVVYPICAIILYPIYTALGGKENLNEYIKKL